MKTLTLLTDWALNIIGGAIIGMAWLVFLVVVFTIIKGIFTMKTHVVQDSAMPDGVKTRLTTGVPSLTVFFLSALLLFLVNALGLWLIEVI
jgi:hypothetical protein